MKALSAALVLFGAWAVAQSADKGGGPAGPMSSKEYTVAGHDKQVVCYWGTWANYRPGDGKFTPKDIDPSLCTNLIYSFAGLDSETSSIKSLGTLESADPIIASPAFVIYSPKFEMIRGLSNPRSPRSGFCIRELIAGSNLSPASIAAS